MMKTESSRGLDFHQFEFKKSHTFVGELGNSEAEQSTEHIDTAEIQLPKVEDPVPPSSQRGPRCTEASIRERLSFEFERNRIRVLGKDHFVKCVQEGPLTELDQEDPRMFRILQHNQMIISFETERVMNYSSKMKCATLVLGIWSILQIIFSMAFAFVLAIESLSALSTLGIVLGFNLLLHLWLLKLSLIGNTVSSEQTVVSNSESRFYKMCGLTLFLLVSQAVIMPFFLGKIISNNLKGEAAEISPNSDKIKKLLKTGYLVAWISALVNLFLLVLILIHLYLFKKHIEIRQINILQQKTLPIGYQLFSQLPSHLQNISIPYYQ